MSGPVPYWSDGQVTLHLGDCLDILPLLPEASVDSIVTDPPYGLEFMGKEWDGADGFRRSLNPADADRDNVFGRTSRTSPEYRTAGVGQRGKPGLGARPTDWVSNQGWNGFRCRGCGHLAHGGSPCTCEKPDFARADNRWPLYQQWCQAWAEQCLRVLKPGGYALIFGGVRTWHRLTCAIEDAGFEIRDNVADLTGIDGPGLLWAYGCLTADTEILTEHGWKPGTEVTPGERVAQWDAETGQISLAPAERIYKAPWDGPMRVLRNADTDQVLTPNHRVYHQPRQRQMTKGVRPAWYDGYWQAAEAQELSTWNSVRLPIAGDHDGVGIGGEDYAALLGWVWTEGGFDLSGSGVRVYQSSVNAAKVTEIAALMDRLGPHKRYDYERAYTRRNGQLHSYIATTWFFSGELAARVRADLPGKRPTYGLLWRMAGAEKRSFLRAAMLGDGSGLGTHSEQFYQQHEDDLVWLQTLLALIGRSGKVTMRSNRPGGSVTLRKRATTELQARHLRDSAEHYTGEVWCVQVPTGAFVARRNGRIFITGNSGFPKNRNVGKEIDRAAGAEREVIGEGARFGRGARQNRTRVEQGYRPGEVAPEGGVAQITAPATEEAAQWEGWGTALKPSWEPIVMARKPLAGTVVQNVLAHGTGALNIAGCKVPHASAAAHAESENKNRHADFGSGPRQHQGVYVGMPAADRAQYDGADGRWPPNLALGETAAAELDRQSGTTTSRVGQPRQSAKPGDGYGMTHTGAEYADTGGASRFYPVFRYQAKAPTAERPRLEDGTSHPTVKPVGLMSWLVRLVTRPGGLVLDPFAGSGATAEACVVEGFRCVLIEKDPKSVELIRTRLRKDIQPDLFGSGGAA